MNKYHLIIIIPILLTFICFFIIRIPRNITNINLELTEYDKQTHLISNRESGMNKPEKEMETSGVSSPIQKEGKPCYMKVPYSIIKNSNSSFTLCLSDREDDVNLFCPTGTILNEEKRICESYADVNNPCFGKPNFTKIAAVLPVNNYPKNRGFNVCFDNSTAYTQLCPDSNPFFDGNVCIPYNDCYLKRDGFQLPHEKYETSFYECVNGEKKLGVCPTGYYFYKTQCVSQNECFLQENGKIIAITDQPDSFIECVNGYPMKRKCPVDSWFHNVKKLCVRRSHCFNKSNQNIAIDSEFLVRSKNGYKCNENEETTRITCPKYLHVFDENIGQCRSFNSLTDLKPGKVYPLNQYQYMGNLERNIIKQVDFGNIVDEKLGIIKSVCENRTDRTLISHPSSSLSLNPTEMKKYIECFNWTHNIKECEQDEVFDHESSNCKYAPCLFHEKGTAGITLNNPLSRFVCKDKKHYSFIFNCPIGTKPDVNNSNQYTICGLDKSVTKPTTGFPTYIPNDDGSKSIKFPQYIDKFNYYDSFGNLQTCSGRRGFVVNGIKSFIYNVASKFLFECVDEPCSKLHYRSWPLIPNNDATTGYECVNNRVVRYIDCNTSGKYINFRKVFSGDDDLDDCTGKNEYKKYFESVTKIGDVGELSILEFDYEKNNGIPDLDNYPLIKSIDENGKLVWKYRRDEIYSQGEALKEPLYSIVSDKDIDSPVYKVVADKKCGSETILSYFGHPQYYTNCRWETPKASRCSNNGVLIKGSCKGKDLVNVIPIFSNCSLFALGIDKDTYRLFKCPNKAPIFSYILNKCTNQPLEGHLLCEQFYWKNYEFLSWALSHNLPNFKIP